MRSATLVAFAAALAAIWPTAFAQDLRGHVASGRDLASHWCSDCHQIGRGAPVRPDVPTFEQVARLPSTTALSLRVFLRTSHANMPNIQLSDADADDLIAYILTLKDK